MHAIKLSTFRSLSHRLGLLPQNFSFFLSKQHTTSITSPQLYAWTLKLVQLWVLLENQILPILNFSILKRREGEARNGQMRKMLPAKFYESSQLSGESVWRGHDYLFPLAHQGMEARSC